MNHSSKFTTDRVCPSRWWLLVALFLLAPTAGSQGRTNPSLLHRISAKKRSISVEDVISMSQVVEDASGNVGWFSPDKNAFLVIEKRGDLKRDVNDFKLLFYRTKSAMEGGQPEVISQMSSSSNGEAIQNPQWLADNRTVVFLGERPQEASQVYKLDIEEKIPRALTRSALPIDNYAIDSKANVIAYITGPAGITSTTEPHESGALIVTGRESLSELLCKRSRASDDSSEGEQLYIQKGHRQAQPIAIQDYIPKWGHTLYMSPDGRHLVVGVVVRRLPSDWEQYQDPYLQRVQTTYRAEGSPAFFVERYLLVDTDSGLVQPLLDTPMIGFRPFRWSSDSQSILLAGVYVPIEGDAAERASRSRDKYDIRMWIEGRKIEFLSQENWPSEEPPPLHIWLKEGMNTRPKLFVEDRQGDSRLLLDPNPAMDELAFGDAEIVEWRAADGHRVKGELYKPPDFEVGKRYPLVIQTHGFHPDRFCMDGPWSSAFSARPLAASGILVLQLDYDHSFEVTPEEGRREMASFEGAVEMLAGRGSIDPQRVGIIGFSRTVYHVEYALTHSKFHFAAASLVDGIDAGYLQYLVFGPGESPSLNDGNPFGYGLSAWMANSPAFQLGRMRTPVRMQSHGLSSTVLGFWEWFVLLTEMRRPVELSYLPDAPHLLVKPSEKFFAQESVVDWLRFWLSGERDNAPEKRAQYLRWDKLRERSRSTVESTNLDVSETEQSDVARK